ncbi:MAG: 5'-nucleotidase C-terminal domain-containing protein, partial [Clostridiales bacterium]|nr:5'-nucleotidase C-terminal domain-containing protein [Clostridiales bacterium]
EQVGDSTGFNYARRSLTLEDVEGVEEILDIFSFNDFHGTVDKSASGSNPGADRFVAIVQTLMSENPNSVLLSAGDNYQGSPLSNLNLGGPVSDMIDYLGVEYGVPGNHEFDWGADLLPTFAEDGGLTFLAANIVDTETGEYPEYIEPYTVIEIGSKKVAFIGIANPGTPSLVKAENVEGLEFLEPGDWTNELIDELKEDNDLVIAFTHLDSYQDEEGVVTGSAATLAETCPGFDAIISGHSHRVVAGYVNDIPVVQGNYNGRGLARLTVVYSGDGFEIYPKAYVQNDMNTNAILPSTPLVVNADVKANIAEYNEAIGPLFAETAGVYGEDIDSREKQADWATRLVFDYIERIEGEPYVLIQNNGGWRDTSPYDKKADDEVTMGYLYTLMPFDNEIVLLEMRGKDLIYMLDLGVDGGGAQTEPATVVSAQCVAGAYKEDDTWFLESGDEIDPEDVYKVACNDFMLTGGDRYPFPGSSWGDAAGVEVIGESSFMGVPLRDAMVDQLIYRLENAEEVDGAA